MTRADELVAQLSPTAAIHRVVRHLLRLSLEMKLLIPNLLVIGIAFVVFTIGFSGTSPERSAEYFLISVLVAGAALNFILVRIALAPVNAIRLVAERVANGDLSARIEPSVIADVGLSQLASTFNSTLQYLVDARERIRESGARIVYAQEKERASVARELHESIGQTLAAASYQAAAAAATLEGRPEQNALEVARLLRTAIEDLRTVSRELHPRVAEDLGLPAALEALAHATEERSLLDVQLSVRNFSEQISPTAASTLYRVAQDVLRNIESLAASGTVSISMSSDHGMVRLTIEDNCTFEGVDGNKLQDSLASAAERLSLLGGELTIERNFVGGTRIIARLRRQLEAA